MLNSAVDIDVDQCYLYMYMCTCQPTCNNYAIWSSLVSETKLELVPVQVMCEVLEGKSLGIPLPFSLLMCTSPDLHLSVLNRMNYVVQCGQIGCCVVLLDGITCTYSCILTGNSLQTFARLLMSIEDCRQNMVGVLHI